MPFSSHLVIFHSGKTLAWIRLCSRRDQILPLCWAVRVLFSWNSVTLPPPTKVTWLPVLVSCQCLQCFMRARGKKCGCSFLAYIITTLLFRPIWDTACSWSLKCAMGRNNKYRITKSSYCVFSNYSMMTLFLHQRSSCIPLRHMNTQIHDIQLYTETIYSQ